MFSGDSILLVKVGYDTQNHEVVRQIACQQPKKTVERGNPLNSNALTRKERLSELLEMNQVASIYCGNLN